MLPSGTVLSVRKEPTNPYDNNAVVLYTADRKRVGYLQRNRLQDMANTYIDKHWPVLAVYGRYIADRRATISIDYYQPVKEKVPTIR